MNNLNYYKVLDPNSGCTCCIQQLGDGRYAVQFDNGQTHFKTAADLDAEAPLPAGKTDERWRAFELLRQHLCAAHEDMCYVELAAR